MTPAFFGPVKLAVFVPRLKSCLSYSHGIVCISKAVADPLAGVLKAVEFPQLIKIGWLLLCADFSGVLRPTAMKPRNKNELLNVGAIEPSNGHQVILSVFDKLWANGKDVSLTIVGRVGRDHR